MNSSTFFIKSFFLLYFYPYQRFVFKFLSYYLNVYSVIFHVLFFISIKAFFKLWSCLAKNGLWIIFISLVRLIINWFPFQARTSATAKATVAAFAAAEGHAHPRVVELPKTDQGLGFNVMGGKEQNSPIYISRIIPGGVADRNGQLKRGDQLIAVSYSSFHLLLFWLIFSIWSICKIK